MSDTYHQVLVETRGPWQHWLIEHHHDMPGIWLVTYKKDSGHPRLPYNDIVEEALCFGWAGSRPAASAPTVPRCWSHPASPPATGPASTSSKSRRSPPPGSAPRRARRRRRGSGQRQLGRPRQSRDPGRAQDLTAALDADPAARLHWDAFPLSARRAILEWIGNAKTSATRHTRIEQTARDAASNVRANQWRQPKGSRP
jgi:hypothetical protein